MWRKSPRQWTIFTGWTLICLVVGDISGILAVESSGDELKTLEHVELSDDPNYGVSWYFMPDGQGVPRLALLKSYLPDEARLSWTQEGNVNFHLYTRSGPPQKTNLNGTIEGIEKVFTRFNPKKWTKIIIHGWTSSEYDEVMLIIREAYMEHRDVNVIMVDWQEIASSWWYFDSAYSTQLVGRSVAQLIDYMIHKMKADRNLMHVIGNSLGAHVAGFAGAYVESGKIARVTGLDPAGPYFNEKPAEMRLDPTDAQFVDVIHTALGTYGHVQELGHLDFYPNGGIKQPGCTLKSFLRNEGCSHARAPKYFAESISNNNFFGYRCNNFRDLEDCNCNTTEFVMMGESVDRMALGIYYLETNAETPFAKGAKNC